jgi:hypothetical protein
MIVSPPPRVWAQILCIAHALIVSGIWYALFILDEDVVTVRTWIVLAVLWPFWIISIAFPGKVRRLQWLATLVACAIVLSPTFSTFYSFVVWKAGGFAP